MIRMTVFWTVAVVVVTLQFPFSLEGIDVCSVASSANPGFGWAIVSEAADFNNDGLAEVLVPDYNTKKYFVAYRTTSQSPFSSTFYTTAQSSMSRPYAAAFGDFNMDGKLDTVFADREGNQLRVNMGTGSGTPGISTSGSTPYSVSPNLPSFVMAGDVTGDGFDDIIWCNWGSPRNCYLMRSTSSVGGSPSFTTSGFTGDVSIVQQAVMGNFDGVGPKEVFYFSNDGGTPRIRSWVSGNSFTTSGFVPSFPKNNICRCNAAGLADYNADGYDDYVCSSNTAQIYMLLGGPDLSALSVAVFDPAAGTNVGSLKATKSPVAGDPNGDGIVDIVFSSGAGTYWIQLFPHSHATTGSHIVSSLPAVYDAGHNHGSDSTHERQFLSARIFDATLPGTDSLYMSRNNGDTFFRNLDGRGLFSPRCPVCSTVTCFIEAAVSHYDVDGFTGFTVAIPNGRYTGCYTRLRLIFGDMAFTFRAADLDNPDVVFDCEHQGVLLDIRDTARIAFTDISIVGMRHETAGGAGLPGLSLKDSASLSVNRVTFSNCSTAGYLGSGNLYFGGVIHVAAQASLVLTDSHFVGNSAYSYGGAVGVTDQGIVSMTGGSFVGNAAGRAGGALAVHASQVSRFDPALFGHDETSYPTVVLSNVVLANNSAPLGGALLLLDPSFDFPGNPYHEAVDVHPEGPILSAMAAAADGLELPRVALRNVSIEALDPGAQSLGSLAYVCGATLSLENGTRLGVSAAESLLAPASPVALFTCGWIGGASAASDAGLGAITHPFVRIPPQSPSLDLAGSLSVATAATTVHTSVPAFELMTGESIPLVEVTFYDGLGQAVRTSFSVGLGAVGASANKVFLGGANPYMVGVTDPDSGRAVFSDVSTALDSPEHVGSHVVGLAPLVNPEELATSLAFSTATQATFGVQLSTCPRGYGRTPAKNLFDLAFSCQICPPSSYSNVTGPAPCVPFEVCPDSAARASESQNATGGAAGATEPEHCLCLPGTFTRKGAPDTPCYPCPRGGVCEGGTARPVALPDWFDITAGLGLTFSPCPRREACLGGPYGSDCASGHIGYGCATCAPGWFSTQEGACEPCAGTAEHLTIAALVLVCLIPVGVAVGVGLAARSAALTSAEEYGVGEAAELQRRRLVRLSRFPYSLRIGFFFAQILGILAYGPFNWGSPARQVLNSVALTNFSLDLVGVACVVSSRLLLIVPLILPLAVVVLVLIVTWSARALGADPRVWNVTKRFISLGATIVFVPLAKHSLSHMACTQFPDGSWRLQGDVGRFCYDAAWWDLFPYACAAAILYAMGIPLALGMVLFTARTHLFSSLDTLRAYGFLYINMRASLHWFELVNIVSRLLVVSASLFLFDHTAWLVLTLQMLFCTHAYVLLRARPLFNPAYNDLEATLEGSLVIVAAIGYIASTESASDEDGRTHFLLGCILVGVIGASFLYVGVSVVREIRLRKRIVGSQIDIVRADLRRQFETRAPDWVRTDDADQLLSVWGRLDDRPDSLDPDVPFDIAKEMYSDCDSSSFDGALGASQAVDEIQMTGSMTPPSTPPATLSVTKPTSPAPTEDVVVAANKPAPPKRRVGRRTTRRVAPATS